MPITSVPKPVAGKKHKGLFRRLLVALVLALTPVIIIAAIQALLDSHQARIDRRNALLRHANSTYQAIDAVFDRADTLLALFEEDIISGKCQEVFVRSRPALPSLGNVVHFNTEGVALCASYREAGFKMPQARWERFTGLLPESSGSQRQQLQTEVFLSEAGRWTIGTARPVRNGLDEISGYLAFALQVDLMSRRIQDATYADTIEVALAIDDGTTFGSDLFSNLPADWILAAEQSLNGVLRVHRDNEGNLYDTVIKRIDDKSIYEVISRPSPGLFNKFSVAPAQTIGMPLLVFSVCLLAIWVTLDQLVLKWLLKLGHGSQRIAREDYELAAHDFDNAPRELAQLDSAMRSMAEQIEQRNTELEDALGQRDNAMREVHHRVKNNLQIVTSYLNLQNRQLKDPHAKEALQEAQDRIAALSIVHQTLYQHSQLETVDVNVFLGTLLNHVRSVKADTENNIELHSDIESHEVSVDSAIPLSLFFLEAITNSLKYAFEKEGYIEVTYKCATPNQQAFLEVSDSGKGAELNNDGIPVGAGLGVRLMTSFAKQLHARIAFGNNERGLFSVRLTFI